MNAWVARKRARYSVGAVCGGCMRGLPQILSRCYRCQRRTEDCRTCKSCRSSSDLYSVRAVTPYDGLAKELLRKIKYERGQAGARTAAGRLAEFLPASDESVIVTHIPTAPIRIRSRGFDQARLIARHAAQLQQLRYTSLLVRTGGNRQVGKGRQERKRQMKDAFLVVKPSEVVNRHILLIDDVITTGATLEAAAAVLKAAGAKRVSAAVFAAA